MRCIKNNTDSRIETGALKVGSDWPGVFIRGDNSGNMSHIFRAMARQLIEYADLFDSCQVSIEDMMDDDRRKGGDRI